MVAVYLLVLACLAIFTGLGLPFTIRLRQPWPERFFASFLTGWCLALAGLQIWHLFLPVNAVALLVALALALFAWLRSARIVWNWLSGLPRSLLAVMGVLSLALLFLLVNHALYSHEAYDHGLYHLPVVRWLQAYPIIPGLGNLHHRLAFNNASFLVVAMLDSGPQRGLIYYTATTLLFSALALRGLLAIYRMTQQPAGLRNGLYTLLLPATLWYITREENTFAGYSTDYVIYIFQAVAAAELLFCFEQAHNAAPRPERTVQALLVVLLVAVGVAVKFSFAIFGLGILCALAWSWLAGEKVTAAQTRALLLRAAGLGAVVLVPWLVRHAFLSGYLLFPNTSIALPVPWRIPTELAEPVEIVIRIWARTNGNFPADSSFAQWFAWWWPRQTFEFKEIWLYTPILLTLALALRPRRTALSHQERGLWALLAVTLAALAFWFAFAPANRFAAALLWMLPLIPLLMLVQLAGRLQWLRAPNAALAAAAIIVLLWLQPVFTNNLSRTWLWFPPRESALAQGQREYDPNRVQVTRSGLAVYIAADEYQERCFDQPLPCTRLHEFSPRLSLFEPGNLRSGFWMDMGSPAP